MKRRTFILAAGSAALAAGIHQLKGNQMLNHLESGSEPKRMPLLFIGHGSPMNAIESNPYSQALSSLGKNLPRPKSILVISAHWMTRGTWVTEMLQPKTIHDFSGFPKALYDVQYPAPGSLELAKSVRTSVGSPEIRADLNEWGLDHGTWAVLRHMYPEADIPVVQLSLDLSRGPDYHFQIGQQISRLRDQGVLILASGNLVHNLRMIRWDPASQPFDWAIEFDEWVKKKLIDRDFKSLLNDFNLSRAGQLSVPSVDHYYPLAYILGAAKEDDAFKFEYEELQNGSISMRSFRIG